MRMNPANRNVVTSRPRTANSFAAYPDLGPCSRKFGDKRQEASLWSDSLQECADRAGGRPGDNGERKRAFLDRPCSPRQPALLPSRAEVRERRKNKQHLHRFCQSKDGIAGFTWNAPSRSTSATISSEITPQPCGRTRRSRRLPPLRTNERNTTFSMETHLHADMSRLAAAAKSEYRPSRYEAYLRVDARPSATRLSFSFSQNSSHRSTRGGERPVGLPDSQAGLPTHQCRAV